VGLLLAVLLPLQTMSLTHAQDATPAPTGDQVPVTADPAACQVAPRPLDEVLALWYDTGTPVTEMEVSTIDDLGEEVVVPVGPPAETEVVAAVTATIVEVGGCLAAGELLRAFALMTDKHTRRFALGTGLPRAQWEEMLTNPSPGMSGPPSEFMGIANVMQLADGRAGAFVMDRALLAEPPFIMTTFQFFAQSGDRWRLDEIMFFSLANQ